MSLKKHFIGLPLQVVSDSDVVLTQPEQEVRERAEGDQ